MLCDGKAVSAGHGACQEDWKIFRGKTESKVLVPLAAEWAQVARGRYFVHELISEVNSRMKCVATIMSMPGTRTVVADLCMFGLAACDDGGPGFVKRKRGDDHQCETSWSAVPKQMREHASSRSGQREQHNRERGTDRNLGTSSLTTNPTTMKKRVTKNKHTMRAAAHSGPPLNTHHCTVREVRLVRIDIVCSGDARKVQIPD